MLPFLTVLLRVIGTVCSMIGEETIPAKLTTPDPVDTQAMLAKMADAGVEFRKMAAWISANPMDGSASFEGNVLTLGPQTSAVLRTEAE